VDPQFLVLPPDGGEGSCAFLTGVSTTVDSIVGFSLSIEIPEDFPPDTPIEFQAVCRYFDDRGARDFVTAAPIQLAPLTSSPTTSPTVSPETATVLAAAAQQENVPVSLPFPGADTPSLLLLLLWLLLLCACVCFLRCVLQEKIPSYAIAILIVAGVVVVLAVTMMTVFPPRRWCPPGGGGISLRGGRKEGNQDTKAGASNSHHRFTLGSIRIYEESEISLITRIGDGNFGTVHKATIPLPERDPAVASAGDIAAAANFERGKGQERKEAKAKAIGRTRIDERVVGHRRRRKCATAVIKVPKKAGGFTSDAIHEMETMANLKPHPNLVQLLGIATLQRKLCIIVEFCEKGDLSTLHEKEDLRERQRFFGIAKDACAGIKCLHEARIVHRDIAVIIACFLAKGKQIVRPHATSSTKFINAGHPWDDWQVFLTHQATIPLSSPSSSSSSSSPSLFDSVGICL